MAMRGRGDKETEPLNVGVTGHRSLADPEIVAAGVDEALTRIAEAYPGRPPRILSALAEGADRLIVVRAFRWPGVRLTAVLPMPRCDYLADFTAAGSKGEFLRMIGLADEVVELPEETDRQDAYAAAGDEILARADALVVIWDGEDAEGRGGTGEVVAKARAAARPIAWVHANRGTAEPTTLGEDQGRVTYENM
jgi:hypothetical protein